MALALLCISMPRSSKTIAILLFDLALYFKEGEIIFFFSDVGDLIATFELFLIIL